MSWKNMILGERMPAKEDSSELMQRHDTEVAAGMRAARWLRIDRLAGCVQGFACRHPRAFVVAVALLMGALLGVNVWRIATVCRMSGAESHQTATQHQEEILKQKIHGYEYQGEAEGD